MSYYSDLREYIDHLDRAEKLRRVSRLINKDTELHPLVRWQFRGLDEAGRTGFLFDNLTGLKGLKYRSRVATSIIGPSREVYAMGMMCAPSEISQRWAEAYSKPVEPRLVATGPVKEEIHVGKALLEHGGLDEFPIPMATNGWECLPRMTAVSWHSRDPDTGVINVGTYNGLQLFPDRTNLRCGPGTHLVVHWHKCRERGVPLQVAAVIGAVPAVSMVSVSKVPYGVSELAVAGGIAGEPIDVVRCETIDVLVPATAEIVIEGEVPTDYMEPDGASGEHTGYSIVGRRVFAFKVKAITHRKNPIWHDFISQMPPSESSTIRGIGAEGRMTKYLRNDSSIPQVKDVAFHHCAGAWRICVIRFQDAGGVRTHNSVVWQALLASLCIATDWPKMVIAVDEDIDPTDLESVFWAVTFRYQPHRDTKIIQGRGASLDQSSGSYNSSYEQRRYPTSAAAPQGASAILIDATRKWEYTPVSLPKREYMERARQIWEELGFPRLKPRAPWYGYELGIWPEEDERLARLAEKGDFDKVAELLMSKGKKLAPEERISGGME
jgi:4-hydroxy-3-polyprenylbenzoate decarboxylase